MKGRPTTTAQAEFHDRLASVVGCAACRFGHNVIVHFVSIHHIDGRTKPLAHWLVLPLCAGHHQKGTNSAARWMNAIHPDKARFEETYGTQAELLAQCAYFLILRGHTVPEPVLTIIGLDASVVANALLLTADQADTQGGAQ